MQLWYAAFLPSLDDFWIFQHIHVWMISCLYYMYMYMFTGCTNLNYVKAMFTDVPLGVNPLSRWLNTVSATGTFIKSKDAIWTNEHALIPEGWTVQTT